MAAPSELEGKLFRPMAPEFRCTSQDRKEPGGQTTFASPAVTRIDWEEVRQRNRMQLVKAKARAKEWLDREFGGMRPAGM